MRAAVVVLALAVVPLSPACGRDGEEPTSTAVSAPVDRAPEETLLGEEVSVEGRVQQLVGSDGFLVAGDGGDEGLLVLLSRRRPVEVDATVRVEGNAGRLRIEDAERQVGRRLDRAVLRRFEGRSYVLALRVTVLTAGTGR